MTHDSQMPRFILCSASGSIVKFYGNLCMKMSFRFEDALELMWKIYRDVLMVFLAISLKESFIIIFRNFEASCCEWEDLGDLRQRALCHPMTLMKKHLRFVFRLLKYSKLGERFIVMHDFKLGSVQWTFKQRAFLLKVQNCWSRNGVFLEAYQWKWTNIKNKDSKRQLIA